MLTLPVTLGVFSPTLFSPNDPHHAATSVEEVSHPECSKPELLIKLRKHRTEQNNHWAGPCPNHWHNCVLRMVWDHSVWGIIYHIARVSWNIVLLSLQCKSKAVMLIQLICIHANGLEDSAGRHWKRIPKSPYEVWGGLWVSQAYKKGFPLKSSNYLFFFFSFSSTLF